jgi:hypothetical protein
LQVRSCTFDKVEVELLLADGSRLVMKELEKPENNVKSHVLHTARDGKVLTQYTFSGETFTAKVVRVDLHGETVTFDREIPEEFTGSVFRIGKCAYTAGKISGKTVHLHDQSMIRGRFRYLEKKTVPVPVLAKPGMSLYAEDGKTFLERYPAKDPAKYSAEKDLWIGECGPGDEGVFTRKPEVK